jgi:hypothetical protein
MPETMTAWLENLGLGQYADAFAENAIDLEVLADLSDRDLERPCCMDQSVNAVIAGAIGLMRCGRNSGVPSPACGSGQ